MAAYPAIRIHEKPRISANELARYMVSSETAKLSIIRRAKFVKAPPVIAYKDARTAISTFLADPQRSQSILARMSDLLDQKADDPSLSSQAREDAKRSKAAIEALQRGYNQLGLGRFDLVAACTNLGPLMVEGVTVSVNLDLMAHVTKKGIDYVGGILMRLTQPDETESGKRKQQDMALYSATLAFLQIADKTPSGRTPLHSISYSLDVQSGEFVSAPNGRSRRVSDLNSACRMIAGVWPNIAEP